LLKKYEINLNYVIVYNCYC